MQVGVIVSDDEGYIVYINDTYARFLNINPSAEIGKHASGTRVNSRLHIVAKPDKRKSTILINSKTGLSSSTASLSRKMERSSPSSGWSYSTVPAQRASWPRKSLSLNPTEPL